MESKQKRQKPVARSRPATAELRVGWAWPDFACLVGIVLVAFAIRAVYIWQLQSSPFFNQFAMDPQYHNEWAQAFAAGKRFWDGPYFRAPLYPWLLGTLYWLLGSDSSLAVRFVQAGLGSLSCGLLLVIGRQFFSRTVGAIAGLAAATYPILAYFDVELLIPVLITFLDVALLGLLLWAARRQRAWLWLASGLVLGLSAIARPNVLLFAPALAVWVIVLYRPRWRRVLTYLTCLTGGCLLVVSPITIRNYVAGGEFVLIASQGGVNFYIGNNPTANGWKAVIDDDPSEWWPCYKAQIARAENAVGRKLSASEVSQWYFEQALEFMRAQPGQAATLMLKKLGYFWSHVEISNNQDIGFNIRHYGPILLYLPLRFWIVAPLGVLGLLLTLRQAKLMFPLWGFVIVYMISVVLFFVTARYRVPVVAVLILLASHAVCWLIAAVRGQRWVSLATAAPVLLVMGLVTGLVTPVSAAWDTKMVQAQRATGLLLVQQGKYAEAERMLRRAIDAAAGTPWQQRIDAPTWHALGYVLLRQENPQRLPEAVECFQRALQLDPTYVDAQNNLGAALLSMNRPHAATEVFGGLVQADPQNSWAHANLGSALAWSGRIEEAAQHLRRAVELEPAARSVVVNTANALRRRGRAEDAARLLELSGQQ